MARGYDGWVSLFEDDFFNGNSFLDPQPIFVDNETLGINMDIRKRQPQLGAGRFRGTEYMVPIVAKPQGGLTYQFRSDDCLKVVYSHFQSGVYNGSYYSFYPAKSNLDYTSDKPVYTISARKRLGQWSGTEVNTIFFKHGICDTLTLSLDANDDAKITSNFRFLDYSFETATQNPGGSAYGSYSANKPYYAWAGTIFMDGTHVDWLTSIQITSAQTFQEFLPLGTRKPALYKNNDYKVTGNLKFDLPPGGYGQLIDMIGTKSFSLSGTLYNSSHDWFSFSMPVCRRLPFESQTPAGNQQASLSMPFEALSSGNTPQVTFNVMTDYAFLDAFFLILELENGDEMDLDNGDDLELV